MKLFLLAALLATNAGQLLLYLRTRRKWGRMAIVQAEIVQSKLHDYNDVDGKRHYEADIRFKYQLHGKAYEAQSPALMPPQQFPRWNYVGELIDRYEVGTTHEARVIPDSPGAAFLEMAPLNIIATMGLLLITIAYGLLILRIVVE